MSITILCLHGYRQNGNVIRKRIERLLGNSIQYNLICPDGPVNANPEDPSMKGWWFLESKEMFTQKHGYIGYDFAVQKVMNIDNIDYIIGFSQGAVFATLLLGHEYLKDVKGVIIMSGSDIMDETLLGFDKISIHSLHFVGERDDFCPLSCSEELAKNRYTKNKFVFHKHGHVIPVTKQCRKLILDFFGL